MARVDYDRIAATYDSRYERHDYSMLARVVNEFAEGRPRILEVGCGTGHWLRRLQESGARCVGLDFSDEMLGAARSKLPMVPLLRGSATVLPIASGAMDGVLAINAVHHFDDTTAFLAQARRALRPGGALLVVGLDPARGEDRWYVYDYFDGTYERDCERYPSTAEIREVCSDMGFASTETFVAQSWAGGVDAREHLERGGSAKGSSSQLALLSQSDFDAGMERMRGDLAEAEARGGSLHLRGDLHLYGTLATLGG